MKRTRLLMLAIAATVCFLCPPPASAHLNSTGMGPVYDGLLHFLLSSEDIVPVVALALLAGLRGPEYGRRALFLLPASWFVGCFLGTMFRWAASGPVAAISFLVLGGLVAANAQLPLRTITVLAGLLGLVHGWLNGAGVQWSFSLVGAYAGLVGGVFVVMALVSAFVIMLRPPWARIAVRVAGAGLLPAVCFCWGGRPDAGDDGEAKAESSCYRTSLKIKLPIRALG